jgi:hypothetical protein
MLIMPRARVDRIVITHKIQPTVELLKTPMPTNPVKKARLGIFESAIMLSQSPLEIFPFLYRVTALLHDEVYPPKSPRK